MSVSAQTRPAQLPLPGGSPGARVTVHPLLTGEQKVPATWVDRPKGRLAFARALLAPPERFWIPMPVFLVEHPSAGALLVDGGFHATVAEDPKRDLGPVTGRLAPFRVKAGQSAPEQLERLGHAPADVAVVIVTHLHYDHASGLREFPRSTFVLDRREWRAATHGGVREGYRRSQFDHPFDWRTLDFEGPTAESHVTFGASLDLFGDGSVRLLSTPGHTLGHLSVLLRLRDREILLCGDAIYTRESLTRDLLPAVAGDRHLYERSRAEIRNYAEQAPDTVFVPGHDGEAWSELDAVYS